MASNSPTGRPANARAVARRQQALDLRIAGASYRQIGDRLGVSHVSAFRFVQRALDERAVATAKAAERLREIELERCEQMTLGLWSGVRRGDYHAVLAAVKVMERRAKLLGLDAPTKQEHTGTFDVIDHDAVRDALARRIAGIAARLGAGRVDPDASGG